MGRLFRVVLLGLVCFFLAEYTSWRIEQRLRVPARPPVRAERKPIAWRTPPPFDPKSDIEVPLPPGTLAAGLSPGAAGGGGTNGDGTPAAAGGGGRPATAGDATGPRGTAEGRHHETTGARSQDSSGGGGSTGAGSRISADVPEGTTNGEPAGDDGVRRLSREELQELFLSTDEWVSDITMKRARQGQQIIGVYLNYTGHDSPLPRLGIEPGDILTGLNGHPLQSPDDYRWAGHALREGGRMDVEVLRQGSPVTLSFEITP